MNLVIEEFMPRKRHKHDIKRHVTDFDPVYRIVDRDMGRVMADNRGYGLRNMEKAIKRLQFLQEYVRSPKFAVLEWLKTYPAEGALLFELTFDVERGRYGPMSKGPEVIAGAMASMGVEPPASADEMFKVLRKKLGAYAEGYLCNDSSKVQTYRTGQAQKKSARRPIHDEIIQEGETTCRSKSRSTGSKQGRSSWKTAWF